MGTINQPKPSQPKSPVADQPPLQPGGASHGPLRSDRSTRPMPEAPEALREELDDAEDAARRLHDKK